MNDSLIYRVADTFKTDMFLVKKDVRGLVTGHQFVVAGSWKVNTDITIIVDENSDKLVSAMARIVGNLWAYLVVVEEASWVLFFDGSRVKLRAGAEREFGLGNAQTTLKKLKPCITRAFTRPAGAKSQGLWKPIDIAASGLL
jgi:hypothetical protein